MAWLYVSGRGHSGTTFLDITLGNADGIESFGEVMSACNRVNDPCACGVAMRVCPFWSEVIRSYEVAMGSTWQRDMEQIQHYMHVKYWLRQYFRVGFGQKENIVFNIDSGVHDAITRYVEARYIVDSSKEPTRALFLLNKYKDALVIHMTRNPVDVVSSYKKRYLKHGYFRFLRVKYRARSSFLLVALVVSISWTVGNIMLELTAKRHPGRVHRIRHEDLLEDFDSELKRLSIFLSSTLNSIEGLHLSDLGFEIGHNIGGNNIRTTGKVVLQRAGEENLLSGFEKLVVKFMTWPLRHLYGY